MPKLGTQFQSTSSSHGFVAREALPTQMFAARTKSTPIAIERNPSRQLRAPACREPSENAGYQENANEPDQYHLNNTIAINSTDPAAIAAAYQRTRPVSVRLNPR